MSRPPIKLNSFSTDRLKLHTNKCYRILVEVIILIKGVIKSKSFSPLSRRPTLRLFHDCGCVKNRRQQVIKREIKAVIGRQWHESSSSLHRKASSQTTGPSLGIFCQISVPGYSNTFGVTSQPIVSRLLVFHNFLNTIVPRSCVRIYGNFKLCTARYIGQHKLWRVKNVDENIWAMSVA